MNNFVTNQKITHLINISKKVILDCSLENGAIVAANPTNPLYPKEAKNYFYVWPRDAAFTTLAADVLGIDGVMENFIIWLMEKAEGWEETGLFYEKYFTNGLQALNRFQPDQTGTILTSVCYHCIKNPDNAKKYMKLITHSADGICNVWDNDHFIIITNDLWEERLTFPDLKENFTYSLAACIRGLQSANQLFPNDRYIKTSSNMTRVLLKNAKHKGHFFRSFGKINDERLDASLFGIIWPFDIVEATNIIAKTTIQLIEERLVKDFKVYRYEHDEYDGWMYKMSHRNKGAGFWPLLNFWMSIILNKMGHREKALRYYNLIINSVDKFIPEQIFNNDFQKSISPLCWSHTMFILASKELNLIP